MRSSSIGSVSEQSKTAAPKTKSVQPAPKRVAVFEPLETRALLSATDLSILAFGDSITFGTGADPDQSYRAYLAGALDDAGVAYDFVGALTEGIGFDNQHHSIPGASANTSNNGIPSLVTSLQLGNDLDPGETPDVVLLHIGTNSLTNDPNSYIDALDELDVLLEEMATQWRGGLFAPEVQILLAEIIPAARSIGSFDPVKIVTSHNYNQGIPSVIAGLSDSDFASRITLVDMQAINVQDLADAGLTSDKQALVNRDADAFVDWFDGVNEADPAATATGTNRDVMRSDAIHPTGLGYEVMALNWFNALDDAGLLVPGDPDPDPDPDPVDLPEVDGYTLVTSGDYDGDGDLDGFYREDNNGSSTLIRLYEPDGELQSEAPGWSMDITWVVTGSADANDDGIDDIYWNQTTDQAWIMNGTQILNFVNVDGPPQPDPDPDPDVPDGPGGNWSLAAVGDFDGNGFADGLYRNPVNSGVITWLLDDGTVIETAFLPDVVSTWTIIEVADLNDDGTDDLRWENEIGTQALWYMDGLEVEIVFV